MKLKTTAIPSLILLIVFLNLSLVTSRRLERSSQSKSKLFLKTTRRTSIDSKASSSSDKKKFVCPQNCLLVKFEFSKAVSECSSCYPPDSKWRCPVNEGDNQFERAFKKSEGGFGNWNKDQCVYEEYSPSFLAFAGPGEYDGHFFPKCPGATFCACDGVKDSIMQLWNDRNSLSPDRKSDLYWASLAGDEYKLYKGFGDVTGGSWTHFDMVYEHKDGRKQFCGGIESFSFDPQQGMDWNSDNTEYTTKYSSECEWFPESCDEYAGFEEVKSEGCAWWGMKKIRTCEAKKSAHGNYPEVVKVEGSPILNAKESSPQWYDDATCSKKCGTGKLVRRCHIGTPGGSHCNSLDGSSTECNTQACKTWTSSYYSWNPESCPSGYTHSSTSWTWWGGRKYTCTEEQ